MKLFDFCILQEDISMAMKAEDVRLTQMTKAAG